MTDSSTMCVVCQRRYPERPAVCDGDRLWLGRTLVEIVELHALIPGELMPGQGGGQRVSGSRTPPLPLRVDPLDLLMPARVTTATDTMVPVMELVDVEVTRMWVEHGPHGPQYRAERSQRPQRRQRVREDGSPVLGPAGDQVGHLAVASILDQWVRDWIGQRGRGEHLPAPTVPELVRWLRARLDWACDEHPAADEFAGDMRRLASILRRTTGRHEIRPEHLDVPCRRCDLLALQRLPGEDRVECASCGDLLTEDEYRRWCGLLAEAVRAERSSVSGP